MQRLQDELRKEISGVVSRANEALDQAPDEVTFAEYRKRMWDDAPISRSLRGRGFHIDEIWFLAYGRSWDEA